MSVGRDGKPPEKEHGVLPLYAMRAGRSSPEAYAYRTGTLPDLPEDAGEDALSGTVEPSGADSPTNTTPTSTPRSSRDVMPA